MADSEKIAPSDEYQPSGLEGILGEFINSNNVKIAFLLIIIFIILNSEVFIRRVLKNFSNATDENGCASNKGVFVQSMFLAIGYLLLGILVNRGII